MFDADNFFYRAMHQREMVNAYIALMPKWVLMCSSLVSSMSFYRVVPCIM
jgi:hypothetical protein